MDQPIWTKIPDIQNRIKDYPDLKEDFVINSFGLPMGKPVPDWTPASVPSREPIRGRSCCLETLSEAQLRDLFEALSADNGGQTLTLTSRGTFADFSAFRETFSDLIRNQDPLIFAVTDLQTGKPVGTAAFKAINPGYGSIEIGELTFPNQMNSEFLAAEAIVLLARKAFGLGYRRLAWRIDSEDERTFSKALSLGFSYEGVFRNEKVVNGKSFDTAWFSVTDDEFPVLDGIYRKWLQLTEAGQEESLAEMVAAWKVTTAAADIDHSHKMIVTVA